MTAKTSMGYTQVEVFGSGTPVPSWWKCDTHGPAKPDNAWGCPDCVRDLRAENERLRAEIDKMRFEWANARGVKKLIARISELEKGK